MKQFLFFCDGDEGRFSFLKLLAKSCALHLDSKAKKKLEYDEDVYRFRGQIRNIDFLLLHPLSSMDGLKEISTLAPLHSALILISARKANESILEQLISRAHLLGFQHIIVMGYQGQANQQFTSHWETWRENFLKRRIANLPSQLRFSKSIYDLSSDIQSEKANTELLVKEFFLSENQLESSAAEKAEFTASESDPCQELAEICWFGTSPLDGVEDLVLETSHDTLVVKISLVLAQPKRISYGESAKIFIQNSQLDQKNVNIELSAARKNSNQSFILKRNGIMIGRGRWMGVNRPNC